MRTFVIIFILVFTQSVEAYSQEAASSSSLQQEIIGSDTLLFRLVDLVKKNNFTLQQAYANIEIAKRSTRISRSGYYPTLSFVTDYTIEKTSEGITHIDQRDQIGTIMLSSSWEIDLFGTIRKDVASKKALYKASEEQYKGIKVAQIAQLMTSYFYLRGYQHVYATTKQNIDSQKKVMDITKAKFDVGIVSNLDYLQSQTLYLQTLAQLPGLESDIINQIDAICTLVGSFDSTLIHHLNQLAPYPKASLELQRNVPASLIESRPDIAQAQYEVDAIASSLGVAKAQWWPRLFVNGNFGYGSSKFKSLTKYENLSWQVVPTLEWEIFKGREIQEQTKIARLQLEQQIDQFNLVSLQALQEVNGAMQQLKSAKRQIEAINKAYEASKEAYQISFNLYQQGVVPYTSLLQTQQTMLSIENQYSQQQAALYVAQVMLYKALGGGENN